MNGGAPLGRTRSAFIFASSAALASYPGIEALNSSSVPRVKFMVRVRNLILAGIFSSRSISCPDSGLFVGRTVPTMYSFWVSGITVFPFVYFNPDSAVTGMMYAERGASLEQRTHRTVMFQSHSCYSALRSQRFRTPLIAPLLAIWLRGTGLLRSLRKACASLFARLQLRNP